jgi:hypothetical protein
MTGVMSRTPTMARKKGGAPERKITVKVAEDLHRKMGVLAAHRGIDLYDYHDSILRPVVERDYARMIREESEQEGGRT